jgi:hypothetical protein
MPAFICTTCGTQYAPTDAPPKACPICDDERQYVPPPGQGWTTLDTLAKRNMNAWRELEPNLISITTRRPSASASARSCCALRRATSCGTASR